MSAEASNRNTSSSALIDGILGRRKTGKANGTIIDTSTGAPPIDSQGSGTVAEPDLKEKAAVAAERHDLETAQQDAKVTEPTAKPNPEQQTAPPALIETPASPVAEKSEDKGKEADRGRGKEFESYGGPRQAERSVSPGTLSDGRHAQTAGDRGEGYQPPGKMGKLGAKLGFGHH